MEPLSQTDRFRAANEIIAAALALPYDERVRFVQSRTPSDPTLQQTVLRLLRKFDELGSFLAEPACPTYAQFQPGDLLAERFAVTRKVGSGGMGEVYEAEDQVLRETVALKMIRPDFRENTEVEGRFRDEIRLARRIAHPNVCRTFDVFSGSLCGQPFLFFTMEFLRGETLAAGLQRERRFSCGDTLSIASQIAAGLDAAHRAGIIHRDLKPANIMLASTAGTSRVVITDFGLARPFDAVADGGMTQTGQFVGSPQYMAPEQFMGTTITAAADIYTFGLIIFEMISGRRPYPDENIVRAAIRRASEDSPPLSSICPDAPAAWGVTLARALSRDPARRHRSAAELVADLQSAGVRTRRPSRRAVIFTASGAGAVASFAALSRFNPWRVAPLPAPVLMFANASSPGPESQTAAAFVTLLQRQLDHSRIALLSRDSIEQAWRRMRSDTPVPALLAARDAREIALRASANLVAFTGATNKMDEWSFWVRLELLGSTPVAPVTFWEHEFKTALEGDRFTASAHAARWLSETAGASHGPGTAPVRTPQELTTSNWEALEEYTQGDDAWSRGEHDAAVRHLKTALDLDRDFPLAASRMADILTAMGRIDDGLRYYGLATESIRRRNLTDRESLRMRSIFALDTAQWAAAEEVTSRWILEYPDDPVPLIYKSTALDGLGRFEESLRLLDQAVKLRPDYQPALSNRAIALLRAGRFDEATRDADRLAKLGPLNFTYQLQGALAIARLDFSGAWNSLDNMLHLAGDLAKSAAYALQSCHRAEQGRRAEAAAILQEGIQFDREHGLPSTAEFRKRRLLAQLFLVDKRNDDARRQCLQVLEVHPGYAATMEFGCLLARAGDVSGARATVPRDLPALPVYGHWAARVNAEIALASGNARKAIALLSAAPDSPGSGVWPEYLVHAAHLADERAIVRRWVNALVANPARYWYNADAIGPGFLRWTLLNFDTNIDPGLKARASALLQALDNSN